MITCPVCGKENSSDYCIYCMRPITTKEAALYTSQREHTIFYAVPDNYETIAEIPVKKRKPLTLKRIALYLLIYDLIITVLGIIIFLADIYIF